jgi:hypothetical protein
MNRDRLLPTFSIVFVAMYAACVYFNLAAFTYFPKDKSFAFYVPAAAKAKGAIPMFWYGWLTTSTICTVIIVAILAFVPMPKRPGAWSALAWVVPVAAIGVIIYALRAWFTM